MFEIPLNLTINDSKLASNAQIVYSKANDFLKYPIHIHYTDHSIEHSCRVIKIISGLLTDADLHLNDGEKYIIICAALLHDIGMQTPHYLGNKTELTGSDLEKIREKHHEYSERMIIESVAKPTDKYNFGLDVTWQYVEWIALVAKAHRKIDLMELKETIVVGDKDIRIRLLGALIRLADCLDKDFRRVDIERLSSLNIPILSKLYWYRHQYISGIKIDHQKIKLYFCIPDDYKEDSDCVSAIIDDTLTEINNQVDEVYDILFEYGLRLHKTITHEIVFSKVERGMPDELMTYIKTLHKTNPKAKEGFIAYRTRNLCIDSIFKKIKKSKIDVIIFFGGISTRLCNEETVQILSEWMHQNSSSKLFFCYEDEAAAMLRADSIDEESLPKDKLSSKPYVRILQKLDEIKKCHDMYSKDLQERVFMIPITKALNTYPIIVDDDIYCNLLTATRSSESTTAKIKDNEVGKKTKAEILNYMLHILKNSPHSEEKSALTHLILNKKNNLYSEGNKHETE